jgi:hypothetical protein
MAYLPKQLRVPRSNQAEPTLNLCVSIYPQHKRSLDRCVSELNLSRSAIIQLLIEGNTLWSTARKVFLRRYRKNRNKQTTDSTVWK